VARQNLRQVAFNQQYSRIYASTDGFVAKKIGNEGELATAGSPILVVNAVSNSSKWVLKVGLSDKEWAAIETGNKATVKFDAFPSQQFNGVITKKSIAADAASGSFQAEIQVDFGKELPAVGMFGAAAIVPSHASIGFSVPYEALLEANGKNGYVFVTDDKRHVSKCSVTISNISDNVVYVADGLQGHKFVVTAGSPYLNETSIISPIQ
jgi:RND family efflux transporter MFP subunit